MRRVGLWAIAALVLATTACGEAQPGAAPGEQPAGGSGGAGGGGSGGSGGAGGQGGEGGEGGSGGGGGQGGEGGGAGEGGGGGSSSVCGNDRRERGEECDDGNTDDGDGCSSTCTLEAACGDAVIDAGEACDDGNVVGGDGCSADCTRIEACGDSVHDEGEACDDGNTDAGDGCRADCLGVEICGDGLLDPGELCDDGNRSDGDFCSADCSDAVVCGDDVVEGPELCDDGNAVDGDGCSASCQLEGDDCTAPAVIGAGAWDPATRLFTWIGDTTHATPDFDTATCADSLDNDQVAAFTAVETGTHVISLDADFDAVLYVWTNGCGDAATTLGCSDFFGEGGGERLQLDLQAGQLVHVVVDGAASRPQTQYGPFTLTVGRPVCGNGVLEFAEQCDDGNTAELDGCNSFCSFEPMWNCPTPGAACHRSECGDSLVERGERCDDGNRDDGDGCDFECWMIEPGFVCPAAGGACRQIACGDGFVDGAEACDDGGTTPGDGCSAACVVESGWACPAASSCREIVCGDGHVDAGESCDDGNVLPGDGCSAACIAELPAQGASLQRTGALTASDPMWSRPHWDCTDAFSSPEYPYDVFAFANATQVPVAITATASWSGGDGYFFAYAAPFDPAQPLAGCVEGSDDFLGSGGSQVDRVRVAAGESVVLVATTYGAWNHIGPYTVDVLTEFDACGDGVTTGAEACDDGNAVDGDGCSAACVVEGAAICPPEGGACN